MKKTKKFLSILLSLLMIISAMPFTAITALADDDDFVIDKDGLLVQYDGDGGDIVIPDGVTAIGGFAFENCVNLTSVVIPEGVISIGESAFENCVNLTSVVMSDGLTSIGRDAFRDCEKLTSVVMPKGLTSIGREAFRDCVSLTSIIIPEGVTEIGDSVFFNCGSLNSVVIPKSVTSIGYKAFNGCQSLRSVTISDNIETIGTDAFRDTDIGSINYYCDSDLDRIKEIINPYFNTVFEDEREYNVVHDMLPATCTASSTCNTCGTTEGKPLGHNWQKATCTEPKTCLRCAEIDGEPNGHNYLEYGIVTTETCTDPAYYEGVCTICGDYSDSIPEGEPLGHVFNAKGELVTPATCTTPAVYKLKCIRCSETNGTMSFGKPLGHKFEYRKVIRQNPLVVSAKCTECGFEDDAYEMPPRTYMSDCESYYINEGDTLNGGITLDVTLEGGFAPEDASVCIDDEYYAIEGTSFTLPNCLECVENYRDYDDFFVYLKFKTICEYLPATCTKPETCIYCGATRGKALGHTWAEATCLTPKTCSVCSATEGEALGHNFVNGVCSACNKSAFIIDENGVLTGYVGNGGDVVIPDGVTAIGNYAFYECRSLKSVVIPRGVTSIGEYAFAYCNYLTNVDLPEGLTSIGNDAFYYCTNLTSITIPGSVTTIGYYAFYDCASLKSVVILEGVMSIDEYAFAYCYDLTNVDLPEGLTSIGDYAFYDCVSLKSVVIPKGVISIDEHAFAYCSALTNVDFPEGLTSIGNYAFYECVSLKSITIPGSVTSIEYSAFIYCESLTNVVILEGEMSIDGYAFAYCSALTNVDLPEGLTSIGDCAFYECESLISITIPGSVTSIGDSAFYDCISLANVVILEGVISIDGYAFARCSALTNVDLPEGLTSIGYLAFYDCGSLISITIPGSVTSIGDSAFYDTPIQTVNCYCDDLIKIKELMQPYDNGLEYILIHDMLPSACTEASRCSRCDYTEEARGHNYTLSVNNYVYRYTCENCDDSYTVDKSALFASIEKAKNDYVSVTYYVSTDALQYIVSIAQSIFDSQTATQDDVDNAVASIETAINNLELIKYSVTVNKIVDADTAQTETISVAYGEMFNYYVELEENQAIYKWTATVNGKDVKLNTISQDFSQVINGGVTFNCFIDDSDTKVEDTVRVVFYDKGNRVIKLDYVTIGSAVNMNVEAPNVAFYDFIGWEVVSGDPCNVDKLGVSLRANYTPKDIAANKSTIVALGNVKINGQQTVTEFYDAKITLTGADSYAYCDKDGNILQGINGNVIYAPNNSQTIYVCAGKSNKASTSITGYVDENSKLTINAQYYLPSGSTVVEAGIIATNGDKSNTFKSSQQGSSGEYSISLNYGSASGTLNFKSYLTYKDTDGIHTIYSESQAISFGQNA